jgi:glycosyltransferase involved in cell wall biosynthesis
MATGYGFYSALSNYRPFILFIWGSDVLVAPKRLLPRFHAKYSLAKADAVLVDSKVQGEAAVRLGCHPNKIVSFPWFNPQDVLEYFKEDRDDLRERLGWKNNIIVASSRSHEPIYNVECLIEAVPKVIKKNSKCRFLILGGGSLTNFLKRRVLELGIAKYVKFTGFVTRNDVINYINASDIYVSTSLSDGTSSSLLEAMTCKLPPVVTEIPGNKEWITDGQNGVLFPCRDSGSLADKLLCLINNEKLRRKLGNEAFNTVMSRADWHKSTEKLYEIIDKLAKE